MGIDAHELAAFRDRYAYVFGPRRDRFGCKVWIC